MRMNVNQKIALELATLALSQVVLYFGIQWALKAMDPMRKRKDEARKQGRRILDRLGAKNVTINEYESIIAADIIDPADVDVAWENIGGLDGTISALKELVVLPFKRPDLFLNGSKLLHPPTGVLLYGPPGCGKTMLAKAVAKDCGCAFINLRIGSIVEKWYGESQKLVAAVFSLAEKLAPSIIFVDEIDAFLRQRQSSDHEATAMIKSQFMSLWDGLASTSAGRVIVLGATNRPFDVDKAILRRMPQTFPIALPTKDQRKRILQVILSAENLEEEFDFDLLAEMTEGYSGSDLHELCRNAAMCALRDFMGAGNADNDSVTGFRPMTMADFQASRIKNTVGGNASSSHELFDIGDSP